MDKKLLFVLLASVIFLFGLNAASAFIFNGTVYNLTKTPLDTANVTVDVYNFTNQMAQVDSYSNTTNLTGWFSLNVPSEDDNCGYKITIVYQNGTKLYVSKPVPEFPYAELKNIAPVNFFLQTGARINITVINATGSMLPFMYQVSDIKLGKTIAQKFDRNVTNAVVYVVAGRNYSIMAYPNQKMPVNNQSINIAAGSNYTVLLNATEGYVWVSGYVNISSAMGSENLDYFKVVPYAMEAGNGLFLSHAALLDNMARWRGQAAAQNDTFNVTTGFYNMTLPGVPSGLNMVLLFIANKTTDTDTMYGMYKNITLLDTSSDMIGLNATLKVLLGSILSNVTMDSAAGGGSSVVVPVKKVDFQLKRVNDTGAYDWGDSAFAELEANYSDIGGPYIKFYSDVQESDAGHFYLPLLNHSIGKIQVYGGDAPPKKMSKTLTQLTNDNPVEINITPFDPGAISGDPFNDIRIDFYKSSTSCDIPNPSSDCQMMSSQNLESFNPLGLVIGSGALSFRMTKLSNGITVHYKNVDLLASGPPDALFDGSANQSGSTSAFSEAWRLGSMGPEIYDEVLIGIPIDPDYKLSTVKAQINELYDANWNVVWDTDINTTAQLPSGFNDFNTTLFNNVTGMNCSITDTSLTNNLCYIDTTNYMLWMKIPHFSGTGPLLIGEQNYNSTDTVAPIITINSPTTNYLNTTDTTPFINVTINGTGTNLSHVYITLNITYEWSTIVNTANCTELKPGTNSYTFECAFDANTTGTNTWTLNVTAYDYGGTSGNNATTLYTLTIDNTPPVNVTFTNPATNNSFISGVSSSFAARGGCDGDIGMGVNQTIFYVNGTYVGLGAFNPDATPKYWTYNWNTATYTDKAYNLTVSICDELNNCANATAINITLDSINPAIANLSINDTDNKVTSTQTLIVNVSAIDTNLNVTNMTVGNATRVHVARWGTSNTYQNTTTTASAMGCSEGYCTITAIAYDKAGNTNTTTLVITVDDNAPAITPLRPAANSAYRANFTVNATITDSVGVNISKVYYRIENSSNWNSSWLQMSNSTATVFNATFSITAFPNNNYTFRFNVTDLWNQENATVVVNNVIIDNTTPTISSFTLSASSATVNDVITGTCSASDNSQNFGGSISTAITGIDTSTTGTKTATCTVTDTAGNSVSTTAGYTVSLATSGGGGGGGGGGATSSVIFSTINPGKVETFKGFETAVCVTEVDIEVKNTATSVRISVQKLSEKPETIVDMPSGDVYTYLRITAPVLTSDNLKTAKIKFTVLKSWIIENNIDKNTIVLNRYGIVWDKLTTSFVSEDADYLYYEAETPGFSIFAITGEKLPEGAKQEVTTKAPTEGAAKPIEISAGVSGFIIIVIIIGLLLYWYKFKYKKGGKKYKYRKF